MMFSCIAYDIIHLMKHMVFPKDEKGTTISTIRFKLFHRASKVTKHARKIQVQLASSNVFDQLFWQVLHRIQKFALLA